VHDFDSARPYVTYEKGGVNHRIDCDFIAGCDGFHGVCRASAPRGAIREYEKVYPFGWLGLLADTPPVSRRADLRQLRARLCPVQPAQQDAQPLLPAGAADDNVEDWSDDAFWQS
jgi:p-hydroxybenzoate 3-monooxygenase